MQLDLALAQIQERVNFLQNVRQGFSSVMIAAVETSSAKTVLLVVRGGGNTHNV